MNTGQITSTKVVQTIRATYKVRFERADFIQVSERRITARAIAIAKARFESNDYAYDAVQVLKHYVPVDEDDDGGMTVTVMLEGRLNL